MELDKILKMKISHSREGQLLQANVRLLDTDIVGGDTSEDEDNETDERRPTSRS